MVFTIPIVNRELIILMRIWQINDNGSTLPFFLLKTEASVSQVSLCKNQILSIIDNYNSIKAHGCDGIYVAMLK